MLKKTIPIFFLLATGLILVITALAILDKVSARPRQGDGSIVVKGILIKVS